MFPQKIFSLCSAHVQQFFSFPATKRFIRRTATIGSFFSMSVYIWVRLIFHDVPFEFFQETGMILDLLFTGCCLVGLSIGCFSLLMFAADYYSAPVKKETFRVAMRMVFTAAQPSALPAEYTLFSSGTNFRIDKTGKLRYVVKIVADNASATEISSKNKMTAHN